MSTLKGLARQSHNHATLAGQTPRKYKRKATAVHALSADSFLHRILEAAEREWQPQDAWFLVLYWLAAPLFLRGLHVIVQAVVRQIHLVLEFKPVRALFRLQQSLRLGKWVSDDECTIPEYVPRDFNASVFGNLVVPVNALLYVFVFLYICDVLSAYLLAVGLPEVRSNLHIDKLDAPVYALYVGILVHTVSRFALVRARDRAVKDKEKHRRERTYVPSLLCNPRVFGLVNLTLRSLIFVVTLGSAATLLNIPLSSIWAFGGISGIAVGLAAKDVVSNIFTGCMLMFTQPFSPGEKIFIGLEKDYQKWSTVSYTVKYVGWYNTVLEGKDTRPAYIPNSFFATAQVTNISRNSRRCFRHILYLWLPDIASVATLQRKILDRLDTHPKVDKGYKKPRVHLRGINSSGLQFVVEFHYSEPRKFQYLALQQETLCMIAECVESVGGRFERQTRTELVNNSNEGIFPPLLNGESNATEVGSIAAGQRTLDITSTTASIGKTAGDTRPTA